MCGYFCIEFIDSMLNGKVQLDCTNLFYPSRCEKNKKIDGEFILITKKG